MKHLQVILFTLSLGIFSSCNNSEIRVEKNRSFAEEWLVGEWTANQITLHGEIRTEWENFELSISNNTDSSGYMIAHNLPTVKEIDSASRSYNELINLVWKQKSRWALDKSNTFLIRDDSTTIKIILKEEQLVFTWWQPFPYIDDCMPQVEDCPLLVFGHTWHFQLERTSTVL